MIVAALVLFLVLRGGGSSEGSVYVQSVRDLSGGIGSVHQFSGVAESQKTEKIARDAQKTVKEIHVAPGDSVKKGDKLLTYDVEQIQIQIDSAKLEIEGKQNEIETFKNEIEQYERERQTATGDAALSCTQNILQRKSQIAKTEYDIKAKNIELTKLENSLDNAFVTSPIDGTVKDLKEPGSSDAGSDMMMYDYGYGGGDSPDVIMKIAAAGDYRVKGVFNEQNSAQIYPGAKVFLRSRIDPDLVLRGTVSEIDTNPQNDNQNMYYGMGDEQNMSSKYAFYVEPESLEGFMLGQHILIETDNGQEDADKKEGLWLYSSFVQWDGDRNFVWAKNSRDQIEKRYVEIGEINDESGDCEILSGLTIDDYIAYPAEYIEEGLNTTTNKSDKNIPENVLNGIDEMNGEGNGMEGMDFTQGDAIIPEGMEGVEGMEGMDFTQGDAEMPEDMAAFADNIEGVMPADEAGMIPDGGEMPDAFIENAEPAAEVADAPQQEAE